MLDRALDWLVGLPPLAVYVVLGLGAALENVVPPVPADTFVLFGGFIAARGRAEPWAAFLVTWGANVASAIGVYLLFLRHGRRLVRSRAGRWLLHPGQLDRIARFFQRWGAPAIFMSRFLPAFRAIVPVFAGVTRVRFARMAISTAAASALWYGGLLYVGFTAGENWERIRDTLDRLNAVLLAAALLLAAGLLLWWWRGRTSE